MSKKLQRLQSALRDWQLDGLLLTRRDNIAWLTEGASYYVVDRAEVGVASLFVTTDTVQLLAPNNELPRILAEEPMPFECGHKSYSWYQSLDSVLPQGCFGSDQRLLGYQDIQPAMVALRQRILSAANIHADILSVTQSGRTWSAVFADITQSYQQWGFDGMWRSHHQGAPAGYGCHDFIVTPATEGNVEVDTAIAWNPTLNGVKCEDTFMLTQDGLENLTRSEDDWPIITLQRGALTFQLTDWLVLPLASQEIRYE